VTGADRMFAPPPDVPHGELFARLCAMPRAGETIPFPRVDNAKCPLHARAYSSADERDTPGCQCAPIGSVHVRILVQEELQYAKARGLERAKQRLAKNFPGKEEAADALDDLVSMYTNVELLHLACRKSQSVTEPFFRTPDDVEKLLYVDEIGVLVNAYVRIQNTLGPFVSQMDQATCDAMLDRLEAEGSARFPLDLLSLGALKALLTRSVSRSSSSRTASSSAGTPPSEPTPEASPASPTP